MDHIVINLIEKYKEQQKEHGLILPSSLSGLCRWLNIFSLWFDIFEINDITTYRLREIVPCLFRLDQAVLYQQPFAPLKRWDFYEAAATVFYEMFNFIPLRILDSVTRQSVVSDHQREKVMESVATLFAGIPCMSCLVEDFQTAVNRLQPDSQFVNRVEGSGMGNTREFRVNCMIPNKK
jgi:hypothetical protein